MWFYCIVSVEDIVALSVFRLLLNGRCSSIIGSGVLTGNAMTSAFDLIEIAVVELLMNLPSIFRMMAPVSVVFLSMHPSLVTAMLR